MSSKSKKSVGKTKTAIENELKYVLTLDFNEEALAGWERSEITQVYTGKKPRPRYREKTLDTGVKFYTTNLKMWSDEDNAALETEGEISARSFRKAYRRALKQEDDREKEKQVKKSKTKKHKFKYVTKTRYTRHMDDEKWVVDFFHDKKAGRYFVMAEVEMPESRVTPRTMPDEIKATLLHSVPKNDKRFSSRKLSKTGHAKNLCKLVYTL